MILLLRQVGPKYIVREWSRRVVCKTSRNCNAKKTGIKMAVKSTFINS